MKIVSENTLKTKMLEILREIETTDEEIWVMNNGQMVLKITVYRRDVTRSASCQQEHQISL